MTALLPPESAATPNMSVECAGGYLTAEETATEATDARRTLGRPERKGWHSFLHHATLGTSVTKRFDHRDLEPLNWAISRRRRVLAMQLRP